MKKTLKVTGESSHPSNTQDQDNEKLLKQMLNLCYCCFINATPLENFCNF